MPPLLVLAASAALLCTPTIKSYCSAGVCKPTAATTWAKVDQPKGSYSRCDKAGCDAYSAKFSPSGVFQTVEVPGRAMLARLGPNGEFVEIATLGTDVYVSYGKCRESGSR